MKKNLISVLGASFAELDLLDFASAPKKRVELGFKSRELLNKYIVQFKQGKISKEVFCHRLSVLTGMTKKEADNYSFSLLANNVSAFRRTD